MPDIEETHYNNTMDAYILSSEQKFHLKKFVCHELLEAIDEEISSAYLLSDEVNERDDDKEVTSIRRASVVFITQTLKEMFSVE